MVGPLLNYLQFTTLIRLLMSYSRYGSAMVSNIHNNQETRPFRANLRLSGGKITPSSRRNFAIYEAKLHPFGTKLSPQGCDFLSFFFFFVIWFLGLWFINFAISRTNYTFQRWNCAVLGARIRSSGRNCVFVDDNEPCLGEIVPFPTWNCAFARAEFPFRH